jgi:hypothetical protein
VLYTRVFQTAGIAMDAACQPPETSTDFGAHRDFTVAARPLNPPCPSMSLDRGYYE